MVKHLSLRRLLGVVGSVFATVFLVESVAAAEDDAIYSFFEAEQLEYRAQDGDDVFAWDAQGWTGTDYNKFAFKTEGEKVTDGKVETAEVQALYKRLISRFFDVQAGVRQDVEPDPSRTYAVLGVQGLAPYYFEIDANAFVSNKGDVFARVEGEYELLLTQRLILQPSAELNIAFSDDRSIGVGSGLSDLELGLRLRYEIKREFAPYIGVHWEKQFGETADFARDESEDTDNLFFVAGLRVWF